MNNKIILQLESGRDGGIAVFELSEGGNSDTHVFSGDVKQAGEYLLSRCTKLTAKHAEPVAPIAKAAPRLLTPRVLADSLIEQEEIA